MLVRTADDNPPLKGPSPKAKGHIKKIIAAFSSGIKNKTSKTRSRSRSMPRLASAPSKPSGLLSLSQSTSSYDVIRMSPSMVSEQMHTPSTFATSEPFTSEEPTAMNGLRIIEATPDRADAQSHKSNLLPRLLDSVHESSLYAKLLEVYEMYNTDGSANHSITSMVSSYKKTSEDVTKKITAADRPLVVVQAQDKKNEEAVPAKQITVAVSLDDIAAGLFRSAFSEDSIYKSQSLNATNDTSHEDTTNEAQSYEESTFPSTPGLTIADKDGNPIFTMGLFEELQSLAALKQSVVEMQESALSLFNSFLTENKFKSFPRLSPKTLVSRFVNWPCFAELVRKGAKAAIANQEFAYALCAFLSSLPPELLPTQSSVPESPVILSASPSVPTDMETSPDTTPTTEQLLELDAREDPLEKTRTTLTAARLSELNGHEDSPEKTDTTPALEQLPEPDIHEDSPEKTDMTSIIEQLSKPNAHADLPENMNMPAVAQLPESDASKDSSEKMLAHQLAGDAAVMALARRAQRDIMVREQARRQCAEAKARLDRSGAALDTEHAAGQGPYDVAELAPPTLVDGQASVPLCSSTKTPKVADDVAVLGQDSLAVTPIGERDLDFKSGATDKAPDGAQLVNSIGQRRMEYVPADHACIASLSTTSSSSSKGSAAKSSSTMPTIHITTPASMASESVPNSPSPILAPRMQPPATLLLRNSTADAGKVAKLRERYLELQDRRMIEQQIKDGRRVSLYTPPPAPSTKPADIRVRISGSLESMCSSVSDPLPAAAPQNDTSVTSNESPWSRSILSKAHQVRMPVLAAQEEIKTIKSEEEPKKVKSEEELNEVKREGEPKIRREEPKITRDEEVKKAKSEPYDEAITRVLAMPISPEERREKQGGSVPSAPAAAIPVAAETKSKVTDRVSSVVKRASRVLQVSAPFKSSGNRTENNIPRASSTQPPPRVAPPPRATPTTRGTPPPRAAPPPRANPPPRTTSTTRVTPPPRTTSTTRVTPPPRATPPLRATQSLRATPPLRATQPLRATRLPPRILNTSKVAPPEDKPTGERPQREVRPTWSFRAARPTTPRVEKPPCRCERHQRNIARHTDADMRRSMTFGKENSGTPQATPAKTGEQKSVAAPKSDDQKIQRGRQPLGMRPDLANYGDVVSFGQVGEQIMCASSSFA